MNTSSSAFQSFAERVRPQLTDELKRAAAAARQFGADGLYEMISYQMGWSGENAGSSAAGKQIRPLLVLLAASGAGGEWQNALPAAAAVELLHNFSLIHDDIQDQSKVRRGRPTIWSKWGIAQAINTGDAMFSLANLTLIRVADTVSQSTALQTSQAFHTTCLRLTQGQHLDILFADLDTIPLSDYWEMVAGKTAALLAFSMEAGAVCAESSSETQVSCRNFGHALGLAFQAQDDLLGIWGEVDHLGKSASLDLITRKKTLPILFGLSHSRQFQERWQAGPITELDLPGLKKMLEKDGALDYTQKFVEQHTADATAALQGANLSQPAHSALQELAEILLSRRS